MENQHKRATIEGLGFGLVAGVIMLAVEMLDAGVRTGMPGDPLRRYASVVLGFHALDSSLGTTFLVGLVIALALAALFGLVYAQFEWRTPAEARRHYGWQMGIGVVYAALLWLFATAFVAEPFCPWLVTTTPLRHLVVVSLFYGGALGLMFAAAARRTPLFVRPSFG